MSTNDIGHTQCQGDCGDPKPHCDLCGSEWPCGATDDEDNR